ncbi:oligoketide cyclase/lipid transport protein [Cylindrospermum stagnale PCC 7417]|uniref:Oligoketide cyclase/lipid transport protein n=1 Tax=Cylindrospermum stagnale PCC 7417 TaxID=56107 RepID=K9WPT1_9NOST|nr:SRPBCC family protein [Cylindrospermum stagnale]AFZ22400.1 oligoketide cyclase/lipid transport protein [Cylindrospermum stagnale PCC 7417]
MKNTFHSIICHAPVEAVYQIISDTSQWPDLFETCVRTEVLEKGNDYQLVRITAQENGREMIWDTHRTFLPQINGVDFYLPVPMPLLTDMQGRWRVVPLDSGGSLLFVERSFVVKEDVTGLVAGVTTPEAAVDFMINFIERNGGSEMIAIKSIVEGKDQQEDELSLSFESSRVLPFPGADIYTLLADAANWSLLLPHCQAVDMLYDDGSNQEFIMEVKTAYGSERIRSIRRCRRDLLTIEYFQPEPPPVMSRHTGCWKLNSIPGGTAVFARHEFQIEPNACRNLFGEGDIAFYKQRLHHALEKNSLTTIEACERRLAGKK